jgi:hypothetical protein
LEPSGGSGHASDQRVCDTPELHDPHLRGSFRERLHDDLEVSASPLDLAGRIAHLPPIRRPFLD